MNTRGILILVTVVVVAAAAYLLAGGRRALPVISPPVTVRPAPTFTVPAPANVSFVFTNAPALPSAVPVYSVRYRSLAEVESALSSVLNSYGIPATSAATLVRGGVYTKTWSRVGADLTLTVDRNSQPGVVFHQATALSAPATPQPPESAGRQFTSAMFPLPQNLSLAVESVDDGPFDGLIIADRFGAVTPQAVNFSYTVEGARLFSPLGGTELSSVVVDNVGIVRSATVFPPPLSVTRTGSVPVISKDSILENLRQGRASVFSGYNPETAGLGGSLTFTSFAVDTTTLVYAPADDGVLYPAFLLSGHGTGSNGSKQEATYFLWAYPLPTPTK